MSKEKPKAKEIKVADESSAASSTHAFSLSTTSVNKYDPYSLKAAIDEEIIEVSKLKAVHV